MNIIGISCFYHDSAAALVTDGEIVAAAQEERFTRKKHDPSFPTNAINYCLEEAGLHVPDIDHIVYYDNIVLSCDRMLQSFIDVAPKGREVWETQAPKFVEQKFSIFETLKRELDWKGDLDCCEHHLSHAAGAFFPSPFQEAAILTMDGVGEWATVSYGHGKDNHVSLTHELRYPHSLGLLYSAFTSFCGFKVNSGEYKLMGLAPYGVPRYKQEILDHIVSVGDDGALTFNLEYFAFRESNHMTTEAFGQIFDGPAREAESGITQREMDIAASIQAVTEEVVLKMAKHVRAETGSKYLCLSGGVALNCVANGILLREEIFEDIWIQPAAGDAGSALGCALAFHHMGLGRPRKVSPDRESQQKGSYWGPAFSNHEVEAYLHGIEAPYTRVSEDSRPKHVAQALADGKVVGHFSGRMEFGPRALGARSILGDPSNERMQREVNLKIKYRESFRPFAPAVLEEEVSNYFELDRPSPYMLLVAPVKKERRIGVPMPEDRSDIDLLSWVNESRSDIPAVTHVDYSARVQSVRKDWNPQFHAVIAEFKELTGCAVVVNTSFNVRGEPIVCTPRDAYRCFMRTEMDVLVLEDCILVKEEQPKWDEKHDWREEFALD
jgi:carbamoyltransferase